eukprot:TRINITY_DN10509_c0_g1_i2.p1 TRINITY_DN10509_c0_g1~~TRINITY_DN10509_c0_g1_i2.p1  ORF type:complete len:518 (+),score=111.23 TRINITY_DN10509_c0_g1_i2:55-1608(+)
MAVNARQKSEFLEQVVDWVSGETNMQLEEARRAVEQARAQAGEASKEVEMLRQERMNKTACANYRIVLTVLKTADALMICWSQRCLAQAMALWKDVCVEERWRQCEADHEAWRVTTEHELEFSLAQLHRHRVCQQCQTSKRAQALVGLHQVSSMVPRSVWRWKQAVLVHAKRVLEDRCVTLALANTRHRSEASRLQDERSELEQAVTHRDHAWHLAEDRTQWLMVNAKLCMMGLSVTIWTRLAKSSGFETWARATKGALLGRLLRKHVVGTLLNGWVQWVLEARQWGFRRMHQSCYQCRVCKDLRAVAQSNEQAWMKEIDEVTRVKAAALAKTEQMLHESRDQLAYEREERLLGNRGLSSRMLSRFTARRVHSNLVWRWHLWVELRAAACAARTLTTVGFNLVLLLGFENWCVEVRDEWVDKLSAELGLAGLESAYLRVTEVWPTLHRNGSAVEISLQAGVPSGALAERLHSRLQRLSQETKEPYTVQLGGFVVSGVECVSVNDTLSAGQPRDKPGS